VSGMLFLVSRHLMFWWVGPQISPPTFLLAGLALWAVMECCGNTLAMFMNGASIMRFQIVAATLFGLRAFRQSSSSYVDTGSLPFRGLRS